jgi:hypothetical protein
MLNTLSNSCSPSLSNSSSSSSLSLSLSLFWISSCQFLSNSPRLSGALLVCVELVFYSLVSCLSRMRFPCVRLLYLACAGVCVSLYIRSILSLSHTHILSTSLSLSLNSVVTLRSKIRRVGLIHHITAEPAWKDLDQADEWMVGYHWWPGDYRSVGRCLEGGKRERECVCVCVCVCLSVCLSVCLCVCERRRAIYAHTFIHIHTRGKSFDTWWKSLCKCVKHSLSVMNSLKHLCSHSPSLCA